MKNLLKFNEIDEKYYSLEGSLIIGNKEFKEKRIYNNYSIAVYLLSSFVLAMILMGILAVIVASRYSIEFRDLFDAMQIPSGNELINELATKVLSYVNFITGAISTIIVVILLRFYLIKDLLHIKVNKLKMIAFTIVTFIIFYIICGVVENVVAKLADNSVSSNQDAIVSMIKTTPILGFLSVVIIAPILEELLFRKIIFNLFNKNNVTPFIVSMLIFALMHLGGDNGSTWNTSLIFITYLIPSALFCLIYIKSNKNIYPVILVHLLSNLIAYIYLVM